jgi:hypothetical protein
MMQRSAAPGEKFPASAVHMLQVDLVRSAADIAEPFLSDVAIGNKIPLVV